MRTLCLNQKTIWYANSTGQTALKDEYGNEVGEYQVTHGTPVSLEANVFGVSGSSSVEPYGIMGAYDRVMVLQLLPTDLTEASILWIDETDTTKPHDHIVKRIIPSLNSWTIGLKKVAVSAEPAD